MRSQWEARPLTAIGSEHERQNKGDADYVTRLKFGKIRPDTQRYTKQGVRSIENPFSPSFGLVPPIYLDRNQHLALLLRELGKPLSPYRTTLIYGVRGAGKTALLTDVINQLNQQKDWIVVDLSTKTEMLNTLIDTLNLALGTPLNQTLTKGGISLPGLGVEIKGDQEEQMATQVRLTQALSKLKKRKRKLLLVIDEVAPTREVVQLAALYPREPSLTGFDVAGLWCNSSLMVGKRGNLI